MVCYGKCKYTKNALIVIVVATVQLHTVRKQVSFSRCHLCVLCNVAYRAHVKLLIAIKFGTNLHGSQMMNPIDFGHPKTITHYSNNKDIVEMNNSRLYQNKS